MPATRSTIRPYQAGRKRVLLLVLACQLMASHTKAQSLPTATSPASPQAKATSAYLNSIRVDWGAFLGSNFSYNMWSDRGMVFPLLASYERSVSNKWSVGGEILLNGGDPTEQRKGAGLLARYYMRPARRRAAPLAGIYVSPVLNYRALRLTQGYGGSTPATTKAHRLAAGVLLGWQHPLSKQTGHRFLLDLALGTYYQARIGTDQVNDPYAYYSTFSDANNYDSIRPGLRPDARAGIGYQF